MLNGANQLSEFGIRQEDLTGPAFEREGVVTLADVCIDGKGLGICKPLQA